MLTVLLSQIASFRQKTNVCECECDRCRNYRCDFLKVGEEASEFAREGWEGGLREGVDPRPYRLVGNIGREWQRVAERSGNVSIGYTVERPPRSNRVRDSVELFSVPRRAGRHSSAS